MVSQIDYFFLPEFPILRETLGKRARGQRLTWPEICSYYEARIGYYYKLSSRKEENEIDKSLDKAEKYKGKLSRFIGRIKRRLSKISRNNN